MAHVLVIDDEHNIRTMIRMALEHAGHHVVTASDGPEGLEKFGNGEGWDLVLLDQRMPGMDGLHVLREMLRRDLGAKIIMITAFGTVDLAVEAMKAGATDFLRKPFTADVLRGAAKAVSENAQVIKSDTEESSAPFTFGLMTLNGFRIESQPDPGERSRGDIRHAFTVRSPDGEERVCSVLLPVYIVELVKAQADREMVPGGERFWQAMCEEVLANYVWQHATFPPDDYLTVNDLTMNLKHWLDVTLTVNR